VSISWRAAFPLERRELDGETVVYCDTTGDTFKLAPISRAVLDALSHAPTDLQALSAVAAEALAANREAVEPAVADTVEDLESLGIVERVSL
jgi:PqqD family protein of HPr-rel-A system